MTKDVRLCCIFAVVLAAGCGDNAFPVAPVTGRVVCEGGPAAKVVVYFVPLEQGTSAIVGKTAVGVTDEEGAFTLSTYDEGDGAVVGKHAVRVEGGGQGFACAANPDVDVMSEVEVTAEGPNHFDVVLGKRRGRAPVDDDDDDN